MIETQKRKTLKVFFLAATGVTVILTAGKMTFSLASVCDDIEKKYPSVRQISTSRLASLISRNEALVCFDVRDPKEYAVSHLRNALRADPLDSSGHMSFNPELFDLRNKTLIFYCTVGMRSSQMAEKLRIKCVQRGALEVYNLTGGIFAWHNEGRPLVNAEGATDFVHPFDNRYKMLLNNQSRASFTPHF